MGSATQSLPVVNKVIMRKGLVLSEQQGIELCQPISDEEIYSALKTIDDDKAPSVDRFNAVFYKKTWSLIGKEVIAAVKRFFNTGKIHEAINCPSITLVPKKVKPSTVREYRPITCCTILYKVIAKILTNRL